MIDTIDDFEMEMDPLGGALQSKDGILVTDNKGKILMMNDVFETLWKLPAKLKKSRVMSELLTFIVKQTRDPVSIIVGGSRIMGSTNGVLRSDVVLKDTRVFNIHSFPMIGADNQIHGRIWYTRDITEEKRNEDLRNLQNLMLKHLNEGVLLVRARDNVIVYTNTRFDEIFGYKEGELNGKHVSVLNASTDKTSIEISEEISRILSEKGHWSGVIKNLRKNGDCIWTEVKISKVNNSQYGDVWVAMQNDITSHVEAEDELSSYSKRMNVFFSSSLAPMLSITMDGGVIMANEAACELFGRTEKELRKIGRAGMINLKDKRWEKLNKQRQKTGYYKGEFSIVHKDGRIIEVEGSSASFFDHEGIEHTNVVLRDRTRYLEQTKALEDGKALYETLFDSLDDPIVIWDPVNWKAVRANRAAVEKLGLKSFEQLEALGSPENYSTANPKGIDRRKLLEKMGKKAIKEGFSEFEWWHNNSDGVCYPVIIQLTRIKVSERIYLQVVIKQVDKK